MNAQNILSAQTCFFLLLVLWSFSYYGPTKADSTTTALETWCTLEGLSCASWNKDTKDCDFTGCQDLVKLSLKKTQLTGPLPVGLQNLAKLQFLDLANNKLTGGVEVLGKLTQLTQLTLSANEFSGSVEALGKLTNLDYLGLNGNGFSWGVHALGGLTKLETLYLQENKFSRGFEALGKLTNLKTLRVNNNRFTGSVEALGKLTGLANSLYLDKNKFSGSIEALGKLTNLDYLKLDYNEFSGSVEALSKLTRLTQLYVNFNEFSGSVHTLVKLTNLDYLYLDHNQFSQGFQVLGKLTELRQLSLHYNKFSGSVDDLGKLNNIEILNLRNNKFSGGIEGLEKLQQVQMLYLNENEFTGSVEALGKLTNLKTLRVNKNMFTGGVEALGKLSRIEYLYLERNKFSGGIEALGKLQQMRTLFLSHNEFNGGVAGLGNTNLERLFLNRNQFTGSLDALGNLPKLKQLNLDNNKFSGTLEKLTDLKNLRILSIHNGGSFVPPVPKNVFQLAQADLHASGLACKWLGGDGLPSLVPVTTTYGYIDDTYQLKCPEIQLPVLSNGTFNPVKVNTHASCEEAKSSVIATEAECLKAAKLLSVDESFTGRLVETTQLAYCGYYDSNSRSERVSYYSFEQSGISEHQGDYQCMQEGVSCVCNKALLELQITCEFRNGKAQWGPNIDEFKCLGYGACKTDDTSADKLKETSGADVSTCTTLQEGDHCTDYTCAGYNNSRIRNPIANSIRCKFGMWDRTDSPYCRFCPGGQRKVNITHCEKCSEGKFLWSGATVLACKECPFGRYQPDRGKTRCDNCRAGTYQHRMRQTACHSCPAGQYQGVEGQSKCEKCGTGQYQSGQGQIECEVCAEGQYQNGTGQKKCHNCPAGQYQGVEGQPKCEECPEGRYNRDASRAKCRPCEFYYICLTEGLGNPTFNVFVVIGPVFLVALIFPIVKLVQLVIRATTAWKPQSEADAALAKKFIVPKQSAEMAQSISILKACTEKFVSKGWTDEDLATIELQRGNIVQYLGERVRQAQDRGQVRIQQCCLKMDAMHDFRTLYDATMKNIKKKEAGGFKRFTVMEHQIQASPDIDCPRNPSELLDLYNSGRAVYDRFHAFIGGAAKVSDTAYVYKTHGNTRQPGIKGIYRVLEKGLFKYNDDPMGALDLSQVRDLVRGGIIDLTMLGLATIGEYILASDKVTVCRVKDRFNNPSAAGWTDMLVNFYFNDDPVKHVCELQLIHFKMLSQRTTQEGHGAYNVFRAASELLAKTHSSRRRLSSSQHSSSSSSMRRLDLDQSSSSTKTPTDSPRSPKSAKVVPMCLTTGPVSAANKPITTTEPDAEYL